MFIVFPEECTFYNLVLTSVIPFQNILIWIIRIQLIFNRDHKSFDVQHHFSQPSYALCKYRIFRQGAEKWKISHCLLKTRKLPTPHSRLLVNSASISYTCNIHLPFFPLLPPYSLPNIAFFSSSCPLFLFQGKCFVKVGVEFESSQGSRQIREIRNLFREKGLPFLKGGANNCPLQRLNNAAHSRVHSTSEVRPARGRT